MKNRSILLKHRQSASFNFNITLLCRLTGIFATAVLMVGCRIEIAVPEGGSVVSKSGSYRCLSGQTCLVDVYDIHFKEDFVAKPKSGYKFVKWRKRNKGLCGGNATSCDLETSSFLEHPALMAILRSDEIFYLEPIFEIIPLAPPPPNPYSKYNGVWRLEPISLYAYCSNGQTYQLFATATETSIRFDPDGTMTFFNVRSTPIPGQFVYYSNLQGKADSTSVIINVRDRVLDPQVGIVTSEHNFEGRFTNESIMYGNVSARFFAEDFGISCTASYRRSAYRLAR